MKKHQVSIRPNGTVEFIYHDSMLPYMDNFSHRKITRVSHVEPNEDGMWVADMSPVNGPHSPPFTTREEALQWESEWLENNYLTHSS